MSRFERPDDSIEPVPSLDYQQDHIEFDHRLDSDDSDDDLEATAPLTHPEIDAFTRLSDHTRGTQASQSTTKPGSTGKKEGEKKKKKKDKPLLRYRNSSIYLLACYLPFLIVPWVLTCILAIRPLNQPSYYNQQGTFSADTYLALLFWLGFVRVLNAIGNVLTVPVTSTLLAHGAVVFIQRRKKGQRLNLEQTLALADRGWANIPLLRKALRGSENNSRYLRLAAALLVLNAAQAPIQQALVNNETFAIMTCLDNPIYPCNGGSPIVISFDPEPYDLALTPQNLVLAKVKSKLSTVNFFDEQLLLWHDPATNYGNVDLVDAAFSNTFNWYYTSNQPNDPTYFVSAVPNNTITGVLREHAMRLNSTSQCTLIEESSYPDSCEGDLPFVKSFESPGNLVVDVCVPGNHSDTPWTYSRDRQDISEDLFIRVYVPYGSKISDLEFDIDPLNFTVHCVGNTTRGYFELGNYRNSYAAGPLIETWPSVEILEKDYNDYINVAAGYATPQTINKYPYDKGDLIWSQQIGPSDTWNYLTPGPLTTSALAMFGQGSLFDLAASLTSQSNPPVYAQICQSGNVPFISINDAAVIQFGPILSTCGGVSEEQEPTDGLLVMVFSWIMTFSNTNDEDITGVSANQALEVAMFISSEAWLTTTQSASSLFLAREIFYSQGSAALRPVKSLASTVIVSALILLQIVGLGVLVRYIYSIPTWTTALDSLAVAQLTKGLDDETIPPIGKASDETGKQLTKISGLVGIWEDLAESTKDVGTTSADYSDAPAADITAGTHSTDVEISTTTVDVSLRSTAASPIAPNTLPATTTTRLAESAAVEIPANDESSIGTRVPSLAPKGTVASRPTAIKQGEFTLARGGTGIITRHHAPPKEIKWPKWRKRAKTKVSEIA